MGNLQRQRGFTFVEAIIVTVIACSMMIVIQSLFSHTVKVTMKGQDNLDSIRAASQLFSSLRRDMLQFVSLSTGGARATIALGSSEIPDTATFSTILTLKKQTDRITYTLVENGGKNYIERVLQTPSNPAPQRKLFGVPRMKDFGVLYVLSPNKVNSLVKNVGQLLVKVTVDSEDARFPSKEVKLTSVFFSDRLADSDWNYLDF
ncbi:MAG TPA: type II secretion system protein [Candidatus Rifleibacterium sp.]|jgi:type II secretory pathway pseudopilin PulG|nr:type II secretion system protein [Candidatus Rifleibacterium sp.]HOI92603.1 type II secretion system protein [Candidatus Rifleibacterium sp.]HPW57475.1 type II secretion system protein [Candidatus Rifleibacterium sp.]